MLQHALATSALLIFAQANIVSRTNDEPTRWTSAGWYVTEEKPNGASDVIRKGPLLDEGTCFAVRASDYPPGLRGHPELDSFHCRELLTAPNQALK